MEAMPLYVMLTTLTTRRVQALKNNAARIRGTLGAPVVGILLALFACAIALACARTAIAAPDGPPQPVLGVGMGRVFNDRLYDTASVTAQLLRKGTEGWCPKKVGDSS